MKFSRYTKLIAFADNLAILTYGKMLCEAEAFENSALATTENWAWENKIKFKESKSKAMIIERKRSHDEIKIFRNNRRLEQVTEIKYLGIYFDSSLVLQAHRTHS